MHYLVTGGCGFIGSHLTERLLAEGHEVSVIDDLSSGKRENISPRVNLIVADITEKAVFDEIIAQFDGCFHLAAIVSVQRSTEEWLRTHQVNLSGTIALFAAIARKQRKIPVVFASSAAVYGDSKELPLKESTFCQPLSAYGADKFSCELHADVAARIHSIPNAGLRFFNVFGPRQDPSSPYSGVISIFAHRMKNNLPVTIFGDGEQTRDFIYVDDVVSGLCAAMKNLEEGAVCKEVRQHILNLCTGNKTSINELAQIIVSITNSRSQIIHDKPRIGDIRASLGDVSLKRKILQINDSISLRDGLQQTINYQ